MRYISGSGMFLYALARGIDSNKIKKKKKGVGGRERDFLTIHLCPCDIFYLQRTFLLLQISTDVYNYKNELCSIYILPI